MLISLQLVPTFNGPIYEEIGPIYKGTVPIPEVLQQRPYIDRCSVYRPLVSYSIIFSYEDS